MIRPLRRAHRWITAALAIALPLAYGSVLFLRPAIVPSPMQPTATRLPLAVTSDLHAGLAHRADGTWDVLLAWTGVAPDLLVYWSDTPMPTLNLGAVLLGAPNARPQRFTLPRPESASGNAFEPEGYLTIYSVAYHSVMASVPLAALERLP